MIDKYCVNCKKEFRDRTKNNTSLYCCSKCAIYYRYHFKGGKEKSKIKWVKNKEKMYKNNREWFKNNKEKQQKYNYKWYNNNIPKAREFGLKSYYKKREINIQRMREYRKLNKERMNSLTREWHLKNKEWEREYKRENYHKVIKMNPLNRVKKSIVGRVKCKIRCGHPNPRERFVGIPERLESLFEEGMNWKNHGVYWHIDHIIPMWVASNEEDVWLLNSAENLRPLVWKENNRKGKKITWENIEECQEIVKRLSKESQEKVYGACKVNVQEKSALEIVP